MNNLELTSRALTFCSISLSASWFALNLDIIVGIVTLLALISAIIANIVRIKRDNSARRIDELHELERQINKKNEKKPD